MNYYRNSNWTEYGKIYGNLATYYPEEADEVDAINELCSTYFEDAACTQLQSAYRNMTDAQLTSTMTSGGMPTYMIDIALKIKNNSWASYEQEFRIHNYTAYSDAKYWLDKLMIDSGSYMGNPTGIYIENEGDKLYVFVDDDLPSDASLFFAGLGVNKVIKSGVVGQRLKKGLNIIDGEEGCYYYVVYTADTKSMNKRVSEWPMVKIHIEGGIVEGYYDASRHTDADYKALINRATYPTFVVRGVHSVMNLKTEIFRETFPNSIQKASACLDSLYVWENDLCGISEAVANGEKAGAPWYLTGGEAYYPCYFNNPVYADNDSETTYAHASEFGIHFSVGATKTCLNPYENYDEGGVSHEIGHQHQRAIKLEGTEEGSNDLFANVNRMLVGQRASTGWPLSVAMKEFARHEPFYFRSPDNCFLRMYYSLYLYYHQAQKNTSFYPELFKALRKDKLQIYGANTNNSGLKFVRKVCEVAQEDLTDFFTVYGFFEPVTNRYLESYGDHYITATKTTINNTKKTISQYPRKNREIIFIDDRIEYIPTTGFVVEAGQQRYYRDEERVGMCGDVGQFTDYLPGACEPANYTYLLADTLFVLNGSGGVGFLMLDAEGNIKYASNDKAFSVPSSVGHAGIDFFIYAIDADGTLHEVQKAGDGEEKVQNTAGKLSTMLSDQAIKATISGSINSSDIKYMRQLIDEGNLISIDLTNARVISGGSPYLTENGTSYRTSSNNMGSKAFERFGALISIDFPLSLKKIDSWSFSRTGLSKVVVPDNVTTIGGDAFSYCKSLRTLVLGKGVKTLESGVFFASDNLLNVYAQPLTPPTRNGVLEHLFSMGDKAVAARVIHVYPSAVEAYVNAGWGMCGTIVGDLTTEMLDAIESPEADNTEIWSKIQEDNQCYDLFGRKVTNVMPGTIYIRNGKKFMMK